MDSIQQEKRKKVVAKKLKKSITAPKVEEVVMQEDLALEKSSSNFVNANDLESNTTSVEVIIKENIVNENKKKRRKSVPDVNFPSISALTATVKLPTISFSCSLARNYIR